MKAYYQINFKAFSIVNVKLLYMQYKYLHCLKLYDMDIQSNKINFSNYIVQKKLMAINDY